MRSHRPGRWVGEVDGSLRGQHREEGRRRTIGSDPTHGSLMRLVEVFEGLAGDVAFQAAHDLSGRQALG